MLKPNKKVYPEPRRRVFVGMSGGVDSSVAAMLLKNQGYDVVGIFMRCWSQSSSDVYGIGVPCGAERDAEDARRVAEHLGIPFYVWDFEEEYKQRVVDYMVAGYRAGLTPNPDVMCNQEIKFGLFLARALSMGADYISTGHYVRLRATPTREAVGAPTNSVGAGHYVKLGSRVQGIGYRGGQKIPNPIGYTLLAAKDLNKDQSYFLWTLTQEQLRHCLFPIGDYLKPEVRALARKAGLPTADKKDSQGICFLGQVTLTDFLKNYLPEQVGEILTVSGQKIGEHNGAHFYTIGQRRGLNHGTWNMKHGTLPGRNREPFYVSAKDATTNTVVVAEGKDNSALYRKEIYLTGINLITPLPGLIRTPARQSFSDGGNRRIRVMARVRYRQPLSKAILLFSNSRELENEEDEISLSARLVFDKPQKFVAAGQSAVFYSDEEGDLPADRQVLGGGIIS